MPTSSTARTPTKLLRTSGTKPVLPTTKSKLKVQPKQSISPVRKPALEESFVECESDDEAEVINERVNKAVSRAMSIAFEGYCNYTKFCDDIRQANKTIKNPQALAEAVRSTIDECISQTLIQLEKLGEIQTALTENKLQEFTQQPKQATPPKAKEIQLNRKAKDIAAVMPVNHHEIKALGTSPTHAIKYTFKKQEVSSITKIGGAPCTLKSPPKDNEPCRTASTVPLPFQAMEILHAGAERFNDFRCRIAKDGRLYHDENKTKVIAKSIGNCVQDLTAKLEALQELSNALKYKVCV